MSGSGAKLSSARNVETMTLRCVFCSSLCSRLKPKLLSCLHTSCSDCLTVQLAAEQSTKEVIDVEGGDVIRLMAEVVCPECRVSTQQDQITDHVLADQVCTACQEEESLAAARCEDCEELLCQECTRAHLRVRLTRNHRLVSVRDTNVCLSHPPDNPRLVCQTCRKFICSQCPPPAGCSQDHDWTHHQTAADEVREGFRQNINNLQQKKVELEKSLTVLRSSISSIDSSEKTLQMELDKIQENLLGIVQGRHQQLVEEVTRSHRKKRNLLETRKSHLESIRSQIDQCKHLVTSVLQPSEVPDQNILEAEEVIQSQLRRLQQSKVGLRPEEIESRLELSFQSKFRGESLLPNLKDVVRLVMTDVHVTAALRVREEEAGTDTAQVRQSPAEEEGERRPVRQLQTRQPAPGLGLAMRTVGQRSSSAPAPGSLSQRETPVKPSRAPPGPVVGGDVRSSREESGSQTSPGQSGPVRRSSRPRRLAMTSLMEEEPQSDSENNQVPSEAALGEPGEAIESVLDHRAGRPGATGPGTKFWAVREGGDPNLGVETGDTEEQFLVKWRGRSHLNNTWESQATLEAMKELKSCRKLQNYQKKLSQQNTWRKTAGLDEVEQLEVQRQRDRQLRESYLDIQRVFGERRKGDTTEYFVKWTNLNYEDASWEEESVIKAHYAEALSEYQARKGSTDNNPRNFLECMNFVPIAFRPLKCQPSFLGSDGRRLRDYQLEGLNFLLAGWDKRHGLILADEMVSFGFVFTIIMVIYFVLGSRQDCPGHLLPPVSRPLLRVQGPDAGGSAAVHPRRLADRVLHLGPGPQHHRLHRELQLQGDHPPV